MLATLRSATFVKAMMIIVAAAFVALIVFEWGADFSSTGRGPSNVVGIVNGQEITREAFDQRIQNAVRMEKSRGVQAPEFGRLIQQEWDKLVSEILVAQEIERYQIAVSDPEVNFFNRQNPAPEIRGIDFFHTDGEFDLAKYHQFLDSPSTYSDVNNKQLVLYAENRAREQLLSGKLQDLVTGSIHATTPEVRDAFVARNEQVKVEYAGVEAARLPDSIVAVSDADISAYYDAHKDQFRQDEAVKASFVTFPKVATPRDEQYTREEIDRVYAEVAEGADFARVAAEVSEDPGSAQRGGDLGFFARGQMVGAFEDSAFTLAPGTVSRPFRTQFGWHILKVEERKGSGDSLQVRARHVLVRVQPGRDTLDSLRLVAEEFYDLAVEKGFSRAVTDKGLQTSDTGFISAGAFFPLLGNRTTGLVRTFLESDPGTVSTTYETDRGIYVFNLESKRDAGTRPLAEVENQVAGRVRQEKKVEAARAKMQALLSDVRGGTSLEAAATAHGVRYAAPEPFTREDFVPIVGGNNAFVGVAFRTPEGALSDVVATRNGAYVLRVLEKTPADESEFEEEQPTLANQIISKKRNDLLTAWFTDIRDEAQIEDYRHRFYTEF